MKKNTDRCFGHRLDFIAGCLYQSQGGSIRGYQRTPRCQRRTGYACPGINRSRHPGGRRSGPPGFRSFDSGARTEQTGKQARTGWKSESGTKQT